MPGNAILWRDGPVSVPLNYQVPQGGLLQPLTVEATIDGSAAASEFYAVLQVLDPNGRSMGKYRSDPIAAGGSADNTWFLGAELEEASPLAAAYAAAVLNLGPWAFWMLSEPAGATQCADSSGHGRTLDSITSNITLGQPGLVPTSSATCAFSAFTNTSFPRGIGTANTQLFTPQVVTLEYWLSTSGVPGNSMEMFVLGTSGSPSSRLFSLILNSSGQPLFQYQDVTNTLQSNTFSVGVVDGVTHQLVISLDGSHVTAYLDGVEVEQQPQVAAMIGGTSFAPIIGQASGGAGVRVYDGFQGPVVVYDKVLSAAEIAGLYNNGSGTSSGGAVASVTAADSSITVSGTATNPQLATASVDVIASDHPTAADWSNNSHRITSVTDPSGAQDAATKAYVDAHAGAVSSVFGRTGAVVAVNGDYNGIVASGLTGATQATRYVGATSSGAPASGTFAVGDFVVARDGHIFVCTTAGSPGTWADVGSGAGAVSSVFGRTGAVVAASNDYTLNQIGNATADYSINSHKLTNLANPASAQDAATKAYVDAGTSTISAFGNVLATPNTPLTTGVSFSTTANLIQANRIVIPFTGTMHDIAVMIGTSAGNVDVGVYDTSATTRNRLFSTGAAASPGTGWRILGDPNLAVNAGDEYDLACIFSVNTAALYHTTAATTLPYRLPAGFLPGAGGAPFMGWSASGSGSTLPTTVAEAGMSAQAPILIIARIA